MTCIEPGCVRKAIAHSNRCDHCFGKLVDRLGKR